MDKTAFDAMSERIGRLERECGRWRRATFVLGLAGLVAMMVGAVRETEVPKTIEAETLLLKDRDGTLRVRMAASEDEKPLLVMFDKEGRCRLSVGLHADGSPAIGLFAEDAKDRI